MNKDKEQDEKILEFFMEDGQWLDKKAPWKKNSASKKGSEIKAVAGPSRDITEKKDTDTGSENISIKTEAPAELEAGGNDELKFGELDYAILKSVNYGFKRINEIAGALQIRTPVTEKHIYKLIKDGLIKYFQYCVLTSRGKDAIVDFEKNNPEDTWKPIDEFIASVTERKKERNLKVLRTVDIVLLISVIILIFLIIYIWIFS